MIMIFFGLLSRMKLMVNQTYRVKHAGEHVANRSLCAKFIYPANTDQQESDWISVLPHFILTQALYLFFF